jgi:hypothetical protein
MELVRTERRFRIASPAATDIFAYCAGVLKIERRNTRFVAAIVDNHGTSARLSCHAAALPNTFEVWISASLDKDGGWTVSHVGGSNSAMVPSARMITP